MPVVVFRREYWFNCFCRAFDSPSERLTYFLIISPAEAHYRKEGVTPGKEKGELLLAMMQIGFQAFPSAERLSASEMFENIAYRKDQKAGRIGN